AFKSDPHRNHISFLHSWRQTGANDRSICRRRLGNTVGNDFPFLPLTDLTISIAGVNRAGAKLEMHVDLFGERAISKAWAVFAFVCTPVFAVGHEPVEYGLRVCRRFYPFSVFLKERTRRIFCQPSDILPCARPG